MTHHERLTEEIIERSWAEDWAEARLEWQYEGSWRATRSQRCLCGNRTCLRMSVLCNELSGERIVVGSTCVKRVLGIDAPAIDRSLDAIERDPLRSVNKAILDVAFDGGWITRYEFDFYCNTRSKRKLTPKQEAFKRKVNGKILRGLVADEELQVG